MSLLACPSAIGMPTYRARGSRTHDTTPGTRASRGPLLVFEAPHIWLGGTSKMLGRVGSIGLARSITAAVGNICGVAASNVDLARRSGAGREVV